MRFGRITNCATALVFCALLQPVAASEVDFDAQANFSDYETFFLEDQVRGPAVGRLSTLDTQRMRSTVRNAMQSEGLLAAAPRQADLTVRIRMGSEVDVIAVRRVRPRRTGGRVRAVRDRDTVLSVELIDGGRTVWQAWEDFDLKADPQKRTAQIDKIVRRLFEEYPPRP